MLIARLIAEPDRLETSLDNASAILGKRGLRIAAATMLEFCGDVLQIVLPHGDIAVFRDVLDACFSPCDMLIAQDEITVPRLFVSDMDSTMIGQECIDELADFAGLKPRISTITERAMRGELNFQDALRERVALLAGLEEDAIERCLTERINAVSGARTLVQTLKSKGCQHRIGNRGLPPFC